VTSGLASDDLPQTTAPRHDSAHGGIPGAVAMELGKVHARADGFADGRYGHIATVTIREVR
jgi:hypothetical protein